jgi:hypothetical protein
LLTFGVLWANLTLEMTATVRNRLLLVAALRERSGRRTILSSFFVALSVFLYAVAGGTLLGPAFGTLVHRAVRGEP